MKNILLILMLGLISSCSILSASGDTISSTAYVSSYAIPMTSNVSDLSTNGKTASDLEKSGTCLNPIMLLFPPLVVMCFAE